MTLRAAIFASSIGLLASGCLSLGSSSLLDDSKLAQIKVGTTTKDDVQAVLGPPTDQRSTAVGPYQHEWWTYSHSSSVVNPLEYVLLVGLFVNGIGTPDTRRDLHIFFNPDGTVRSLTDQTVSYDLGAIRPSKIDADTRTTTLSAPLRRQGVIEYHDR